MSNDQQRQKRVDQLIRLNNKKFKQTRQQDQERVFLQKMAEKEGRYKLKEYAKHIQQVNQKRIKTLKQRQVEKEKEIKRKQKEKQERKKKLEQQKQLKKKQQKEQMMRSRRRRNSLQIQEINKKVNQMASQELRRIKSGKIQIQTEKELKRLKLQQLQQKRKQILARTKKVPTLPSSDLMSQNMDSNLPKGGVYKTNNQNVQKIIDRQVQILNDLLKQKHSKGNEPTKYTLKMQQYINEIREQQQIQLQDYIEQQEQQSESDGLDGYEERVEEIIQQPIEVTFGERNTKDIARILNSDEQESPEQRPNVEDQIFFLSSQELFSKRYLRI